MKKLMTTMNEKNKNKLDDLDEVFEKWYPDLEIALSEITTNDSENEDYVDEEATIKSSQVLEEILSLSRDNQKLLRIFEDRSAEKFNQVSQKLNRISYQNEIQRDSSHNKARNLPLEIFKDLFFLNRKGEANNYDFLVMLSFFKDDYPWIYDIGKDLYDILNTNISGEQKDEAVRNFEHMLGHTLHFASKFGASHKEDDTYFHELHMMIMDILKRKPLFDRESSTHLAL
jgi:hypothetical protein